MERNEVKRLIDTAAGRQEPELILKNTTFVNVFTGSLMTGDIAICGNKIAGIGTYNGKNSVDMWGKILVPGLIDGHIHLESSMVAPAEFCKAVLPHGTTAVVTDPHEIANVMGTDGIRYMLEATEGLPVTTYVMLPSCVPATPEDESGATLLAEDIDEFYHHPRVLGLAEMMNFVGTVLGDPTVVDKLCGAGKHGGRIDGHAPGITGNDLNAYTAAGVRSDHECYALEDALQKIARGQHIMIREGTAAQNLAALMPLLTPQYASRCLFCCDDKHPSDLLHKGHIDYTIRKAVEAGVDPILAVQVGTRYAAEYFGLRDRGAIAPGFVADLVVVDSLTDFNVEAVYSGGRLVAEKGKALAVAVPTIREELLQKATSSFHLPAITPESFAVHEPCGLLGLMKGELLTENLGFAEKIQVEQDILKLAVLERHHGTGHIGIGYVKGYGIKAGAVATSVSHDSHNIIAVGTSDEELAAAVNALISLGGGIVVTRNGETIGKVPLSIGGIMSEETLETVNEALENAKEQAKNLGTAEGIDPFMTLSFLALSVIPSLRVTTKGVIDVMTQQYVSTQSDKE